ncbi:MAG: helix-turn-helix domain-containing protein [Lysinibacillus sp.]
MVFDYLKQFATFEAVEEMDEHVAKHMVRHGAVLTEMEQQVVHKIASHALAYPGAAHLKAETIAKGLKISTKTVYRAVGKLGELGVVERVPTKKLNGIKGANIYRILPFVPSSVSERGQAGATVAGADSRLYSEEQSSFSFNLSKTSVVTDIYSKLQKDMENRTAYMNELQRMLYNLLMEMPIQDELKDGLHQAIMATDMPDVKTFVRTRDALLGIIQDVQSGKLTIATTLRAVLQGACEKRVQQEAKEQRIAEMLRPTVEFYDWLTERE